MENAVSDEVWALIERHLPGQRGQWGGVAKDNRTFINAVFWILRTGSSWRELPAEYGKWGTVHQRFIRWREKRVWETLLELLIDVPGFEWLMEDAEHRGSLSTAGEAKGKARRPGRAKRESSAKTLWPWMRMVIESESLAMALQRRIAGRFMPAGDMGDMAAEEPPSRDG